MQRKYYPSYNAILAGCHQSLSVKSREIIDPLFEAFGACLLPVFECLNRRDVSQRLLRDLVIV